MLRAGAAGQRELENHHHEQREEQHGHHPVAAAPLDQHVLPEDRQPDVHAARATAARYASLETGGVFAASACGPHVRVASTSEASASCAACVELVGHQHEAAPLASQRGEPDEQALRGRAVEPREGLVEEYQRGVVHESPRDGRALRHPAREPRHLLVRGCAELGVFEQLRRAFGRVRHAVEARGEDEVLPGGERRVEQCCVADVADAAPRAAPMRRCAVDLDGAGVRSCEPRQEPQQRRFSCTVRTEHGQALTRCELEAELVERDGVTEALGERAAGNPGAVHAPSSAPARRLPQCGQKRG